MHLGAGRVFKDAGGRHLVGPWHPTEDFRWAPEFTLFLRAMQATADARGTSADLVIAGDFLELWQAATKVCPLEDCTPAERAGKFIRDCEYSNENLGCSEEEALVRLRRIIGAHSATLRALGDFARTRDNRVVIIPGNHDAALVFDRVAAELLRAIGAPAERVRIAKEGYWLSADGLIFAEHGHQIAGDVNTYDALPASCVNAKGEPAPCASGKPEVHLKRPWGENFVQKYYEQYEVRFPIVDNLAEMSEGIVLGVMAAGIGDTADALAKGFKFLLFQQSRAQVVAALGSDPSQPPAYDYDAIRKQGEQFIVESLVAPEIGTGIHETARQALRQGTLGIKMADFSNEELRTLCDIRQVANRAQRESGGAVSIALCPRTSGQALLGNEPDGSLGAAGTQLFTSESKRFKDRFAELRLALRSSGRPTDDFELYVFAHTHAAHGMIRPEGRDKSPAVFNTGAWQRTASKTQLEAIRKRKSIDRWQALLALSPEDLPPCYSFVVVDPYQDGSRTSVVARLQWWAQWQGTWSQFEQCPH